MTLASLVPWRRNSSLSTDQFGEPLSSISSLQREMNRMFNNIWSAPSLLPTASRFMEEPRSLFYPNVEMSETDGHIEVSAEIPGVSEKDIDLTLSPAGNSLMIKGEKKLTKDKKEKEKDYYCAERSYGEFRRTVALPCAVDPNKVVAKFHQGVLEINLTKVDSTSAGTKHIAIKAV